MIRTTRTSVRRALVALTAVAVVPASLAVAAAPASAASLTLDDATGDMWTIDEDPGSDRLWKPAPERADSDIVRTTYTHGTRRVAVTAKLVALEPTGRLSFATRMRDESGKKHVVGIETGPKSREGRARLTDYRDNRIDCDVRHAVDYDRDVVRFSFPRRCIGDPRTLEFTTALARVHGMMSIFIDNPHNTRPNVNVWTAKVRQG